MATQKKFCANLLRVLRMPKWPANLEEWNSLRISCLRGDVGGMTMRPLKRTKSHPALCNEARQLGCAAVCGAVQHVRVSGIDHFEVFP